MRNHRTRHYIYVSDQSKLKTPDEKCDYTYYNIGIV